jgi:quercetin dioxygenase-like cupin family protein
MTRLLALAALSTVAALAASTSAAQGAGQVEMKGMTSQIKFEHPVEGYLTDLNGKYKLRVTETTFAPGAVFGEHQRTGPGIRMVKSGQIKQCFGTKCTVYKAGDFFFEGGDITCHADNTTKGSAVLLTFEVLPLDTGKTSAIPPK